MNGDVRKVGEFRSKSNRPPIRSIKSPTDRATIVSIYPKIIEERKYTIFPNIFIVEPGSYESPSTLIVGPCSWFKSFANGQPAIEVLVSSIEIAESIVKDWTGSLLGADPDSGPGVFYTAGEITSEIAKTKYALKLTEMRVKQNRWFMTLVQHADSLWARSNQNPLTIADEMRLAARMLNLNEKPWLRDFTLIDKIPCFACGSLKDPNYPVCPACRAIDSSHPKAKDLKFAV